MIVGNLGTCLAVPEEEILTQDETGNDMYFISKGDCAVNVRDQNGKKHIAISLLVNGAHFGEIALIYKCKRTATVVSRNYNTLARLSYVKWRDVVNVYPKYLEYLKYSLYNYNDVRKQFFKKMISEVFYFSEGLSIAITH
jgi:CRP-like cAMP-binding protein